MLTIARSPLVRWWRPTLLMCALLGLVTSALARPLVADVPGESVWAWALATAVVFLIAAVVMRWMFPPLAYDRPAGTVTIGRRTVALGTITAARRNVSGGAGPAYVTYRLRSDGGPTARIVVAGRPMRGLDREGLLALRQLVADAPITEIEGLSDQQQLVRAALGPADRPTAVGKSVLITELDLILGDDPPTPTTTPTPVADAPAPTAPAAPGGTWDADDADALARIAALPQTRRRLRRASVWMSVLSIVAVVVTVGWAVIAEQQAGGRLSSDENAQVTAWILPAMLLVGLSLAWWCYAADAHTRQVRRAGEAWLDEGDTGRRHRGLAAPFQDAWIDPVLRVRVLWTGVLLLAAMLLTLFGIAAFGIGSPPYVGVLLLVGGVAAGLGCWWLWRATRHRKMRDADEFVRLCGQRLGA